MELLLVCFSHLTGVLCLEMNFEDVVSLKYNNRNQGCYDDCNYSSSSDDLYQQLAV